MKIEVLFFGGLQDKFGFERKAVEAQEGISAGQLFRDLLVQNDLGHLDSCPVLFAVNECYRLGTVQLKDQDVLALMTPVSGG